MKITLFTSNSPRHLSLAEGLAAIADEVLVIHECVTAFPGEVEDFFVEPAFQGRGVGGALMGELLSAAKAAGAEVLEVDADPNAEAIYVKLGFKTFSRSPSGSIPGRWLPRMRVAL